MLVSRNEFSGKFISTKTLEERFWDKVDKKSTNECWIWKASGNKQGYGQLWYKNTFLRSNRISWVIHFGDIPNDMIVCHRCDNPACVNPNHLFLGTYKDNAIDRNTKGRASNQAGENNGYAKLNKEDVIRLRKMWESKTYRQKELMKIFGVSRVTIWRITHNKNWVST